MRLMSFALTERQLLDGSKTVTRRTGWRNLQPGQRLRAVQKAMGLKKGEKARTLAIIEVLSVRREPLCAVTDEEARREGFPEMSGAEFAAFFASSMQVDSSVEVTRIEFRKVAGGES